MICYFLLGRVVIAVIAGLLSFEVIFGAESRVVQLEGFVGGGCLLVEHSN